MRGLEGDEAVKSLCQTNGLKLHNCSAILLKGYFFSGCKLPISEREELFRKWKNWKNHSLWSNGLGCHDQSWLRLYLFHGQIYTGHTFQKGIQISKISPQKANEKS